MLRNQTIFSMLAALFITAFSTQAQAQTLPKECSTALIQYRGNFQINDLYAQINSANRYRATVLPKRTAEDKANLKRIDAVIANLNTKVTAMNALQLDCMRQNPVYSSYFTGYFSPNNEGGGSYEGTDGYQGGSDGSYSGGDGGYGGGSSGGM